MHSLRLTRFARNSVLALFMVIAAAAQPAKRPLTHKDYDGWRSIASQQLSRHEGGGVVVPPLFGEPRVRLEPPGAAVQVRQPRGRDDPADPAREVLKIALIQDGRGRDGLEHTMHRHTGRVGHQHRVRTRPEHDDRGHDPFFSGLKFPWFRFAGTAQRHREWWLSTTPREVETALVETIAECNANCSSRVTQRGSSG